MSICCEQLRLIGTGHRSAGKRRLRAGVQFNAAPFTGGDGTDSSRATLVAFVNGQTFLCDLERQGLNSALLDGARPAQFLVRGSASSPSPWVKGNLADAGVLGEGGYDDYESKKPPAWWHGQPLLAIIFIAACARIHWARGLFDT